MPTVRKIVLMSSTVALLVTLATGCEPGEKKSRRLIDAAATSELGNFPPVIELETRLLANGVVVSTTGRARDAVPYRGLSDFYAENPDCCELVDRGPDGWEPSLFNRARGHQAYIVRLRYSVKRIDDSGAVFKSPRETFVVLNRSGKVVSFLPASLL